MAPSAVTCPGTWGLPGWDTGNSKCLQLTTYSSNCNCAYRSDAEGIEMLFMLRQLQLICIKCSGKQLPRFASDILQPGLAVSFLQWCTRTSYEKKKPHKTPKRNRRKAFLLGLRTRDLPIWVSACSWPFVWAQPCPEWGVFVFGPAAQKWKTLSL